MDLSSGREIGWALVITVLGLLCALSMTIHPILPFAISVGGFFVVMVYFYPTIAAFLIFAGLLTDSMGRGSSSVAGIPITPSKMMILITVIPFGLRVLTAEWRGLRMDNILFAYLLCLLSMVISIGTSGRPDKGAIYIMSSLMLLILYFVVKKSLEGGHLKWMFLGSSLLLILVMGRGVMHGATPMMGDALAQWGHRSSGAYGDANEWAAALIVLVPPLTAGLFGFSGQRFKILAMALIGLALLAIFQSYSRSGLIGFVTTFPFYIYLFRKDRALLAAGVGILLFCIPFIVSVDALVLRYQTLLNPQLEADLGLGSLNEREQLLRAGINIFIKHPLMGVGTGMFPIYASYVTAGSIWKIAHNTYLTVAVEQGVPGIVSHLYLAFTVGRAVTLSLQRLVSEYYQLLVLGCGAGLFGMSVMALTLNLFQFNPIFFVVGVLAYLVQVSELPPEEQPA